MKLEVGMYVRTKSGKIAKIINKYDNSGSLHNENFVWVLDDSSLLALHSRKVAKTSNDIIDLIEVGDYVNGSPVCQIKKDEHNRTWIYVDSNYKYGYLEEDIVDVVTKEQFDKEKYTIQIV